jgi:hypothetical protein
VDAEEQAEMLAAQLEEQSTRLADLEDSLQKAQKADADQRNSVVCSSRFECEAKSAVSMSSAASLKPVMNAMGRPQHSKRRTKRVRTICSATG